MQSVSVARKTVWVGDLEVDRAPVTNARYAAFVEFTGHRTPAYWPNGVCPETLREHPVVGIDLFDAIAYALWAGGRLPTEMEWALASGLEEHRAFVWGDTFDKSLCNTVRSGIKGTTPVGSYPPAPSGCVDLIGNVWEMTCSAYPGDDEAIIVKGGSWYDFPGHAKLDTQFSACASKRGNTVGFRLVYGGPMRLPGFISRDFAAESIALRQPAPEAIEEEPPHEDPSEFLEVVSHLRGEAWAVLPGIETEALDVDFRAVDAALDEFDATKLEPPTARENDPAAVHGPDIAERLQDALTRRPLTLLVAACLFASVAVWWASVGTGAARSRRAAAVIRDPGPVPRNIVPARVPDTVRGRRTPRRMERSLAGALNALQSGTAPQREEAEQFLIAHPKGVRERVEGALQRDFPEAGKASLRYVLAALAERGSLPPLPRVVTEPPREGLVVVFETIDADTADEIAKVRCTALAEGLPLTVVFTGDENGRALAKTHRATLRGVRLYVDRDKTLARLWGASRLPSVAGVRNGRLAFLHIGFMRRRTLAERVAELTG